MARPKGDVAFTEARKQEILQAAFEVFSNKGFRGGSLSQVSELVGISEAGILHHFKTKGNLLIAVLEYRDSLSRDVARISLNMSGKEFLRGWFDLLNFNISHPGIVELYCIVSAESTAQDHPAHEFFKNRYEFVIGLTQSAFEDLSANNYLRSRVSPIEASRALIALSDGLQLQWLLNRQWDMIEEHRNFFRSVLNESGVAETGLESL